MYDDDRDALAAEYVLGTLSADERDQAEALLAIDPGFAEIVRLWERRLGELNVMVEAVEPPSDVWEKIRGGIESTPRHSGAITPDEPVAIAESGPHLSPDTAPGLISESPTESPLEPEPEWLSEIFPDAPQDLDESSPAGLVSSLLPPESEQGADETMLAERPSPVAPPNIERGAEIIDLRRTVSRWRGLTVAMSAIAALLAVFVAVTQFAPGLVPISRQSQTRVADKPQPLPARMVAVLQQDPTAPAFLLTLDQQSRTITVRRVTAAPDAQRSYELWLIASDAANPRSLGLIGGDEFTTRPIPPNVDIETMRKASYAVSLEQAGGSTRGVPTGPILFRGRMVESLPGAPSSG
jgi:anti-sigma-K factor RskA